MEEWKRTDDSTTSRGDFADQGSQGQRTEERAIDREEAARPGVSRDPEGQVQVEPDWERGARAPVDAAKADAAKGDGAGERLFSETELGDLRSRWDNVQAEFVDEPKRAVKEADQLVSTVVEKLTSGFANERTQLEKQWDSGAEVSTEDLRVALQRYRAFFGKLLNAA